MSDPIDDEDDKSMRAREFLMTEGKISRRRQVEENVDVKLKDTIVDVESHLKVKGVWRVERTREN